jgi:LPXTG-motif cell wall-anchored protein
VEARTASSPTTGTATTGPASLAYTGAERPVLPATAALLLLLAGAGVFLLRRRRS